ncbi:MAG: DODA-type extradiol aromatic ring-opening family dioxygenase [Gallionellaceae bacterium]
MPDILPTLFIPHGAGPCFFMDPWPGFPQTLWDRLAGYLRGIPETIGRRPQAVLVISAHWECERPTVLSASRHTLLYDYYGFPAHTYQLTYSATGSPELAARVRELLGLAGIASEEERERGLDHGVFVPFKLIYPDADVPIVQLSLQHDLDAARHLAIGRALAPLREEGVLIVGSGNSYHNLREFFSPSATASLASAQFDNWLGNAIGSVPVERERLLAHWDEAPGARASHPRSEHLMPLMVAAGAAGTDAGRVVYREQMFGKMFSGFQCGGV